MIGIGFVVLNLLAVGVVGYGYFKLRRPGESLGTFLWRVQLGDERYARWLNLPPRSKR